MKTNLIFKRQVTIDGITQTFSRIIPVEIPFIDSGEGWILSGHSDSIEVVDKSQVNVIPRKGEVSSDPSDITKFESSVSGTAKLVRSNGIIKIVARKGKSTFNQTTRNSVCINDVTKNQFFKDCRSVHGYDAVYQFDMNDGKHYDFWNELIDKEYLRQKEEYIRLHN